MTIDEFDQNDRIDAVDARKIIEIVTTLARSCAFNHDEAYKIAKVCEECCDRHTGRMPGMEREAEREESYLI